MGAFMAVIPVVETIVSDIVKAIDAKKTAASDAAKTKAETSTKSLDAEATKNKQHPGTITKAAQGVAETATKDAVETVKVAAVKAGQDASKVPNMVPQKSYSEAQLELSQQLKVVVLFLGTCFQAEDDVIRMQALLEARKGADLNHTDIRLLGTWWTRIAKDINSLKEQQKLVDSLDYPSTQDTLSSLFSTETVDPDAIGSQLKAISDKSDDSALADLNTSLSTLKNVVNQINNLSLTVIKDVVRGLADVSSASAKPASS
jgi:hypothetical protein